MSDSPLAFCDYTTINHEDLVAADRVSEQYAGEVYYVRYGPQQRWYWMSQQDVSEVALFLSYDSRANGGPPCELKAPTSSSQDSSPY